MTLFLTVLHVMVCVFLVVVVLLQRGKGAEIGAVFGGGSGATLFGSRGAGNFLTKLTTGAAVVFMLTSLTLAYFAQEGARSDLFDDDQPKQEEPASPFAEPKAEAPSRRTSSRWQLVVRQARRTAAYPPRPAGTRRQTSRGQARRQAARGRLTSG